MKTYSKKIFLYISISVFLLIIASDFFVWYSVKNKAIETIKEEAHETILLSERLFDKTDFVRPDSVRLLSKIKRISYLTGHDISFIDKEGRAISSLGATGGANLLNEPDVETAMKGGRGYYHYYDKEKNGENFYYAEPLKKNGKMIGALRVSIHPDEYYDKISFVLPTIISLDIIMLLFSLFLFFVITADFKKSFASLIKPVKENFNSNSFERIPRQEVYEFQEMAALFNNFAECIINKYKMKKEEHYLIEELLNSLEDGIAAFDENNLLIFSTNRFYKILNINSDEERAHIYDIIEFPPLLNDINEFLSNKNPVYRKIKFYGGKYIDYSILPLSLEAGKPGFTIVVRDITDKRRLEKIRTDFVANVSHEFKTPLTSIRGFAETLLNNDILDFDLRKRFLEKIKKQTDYLENLVTDLLKLNRIEKNQLVELERIDIIPVADEIIEEFAPKANNVNQKLIYNNEAGKRVFVIANENIIRNILSNYLANAIQYSEENGTITVNLKLAGNSLRIEVCDEGIGIPPKEASRVFERFYRTKPAKDKFSTGSGLGLAIVKNAVELIHGKYGAESIPGEGSTFWCEIPIVK